MWYVFDFTFCSYAYADSTICMYECMSMNYQVSTTQQLKKDHTKDMFVEMFMYMEMS